MTLVQPSANSRMGVGVKRRMPLMLHESPPKKLKTKKSNNHDNNDNGPTIHELDNEIEVSTDGLFDQDIQDQGMVSLQSVFFCMFVDFFKFLLYLDDKFFTLYI